jgi:ubiquinone biosynthesis UbiH/UbiF/VisC/COQ6 family hydroxylase
MIFAASSAATAPSSQDVIVVGRGAIGCATALGLAQSGLRVALVGPAAPPDASDWDSRIYAISPASRQLLDGLRVWQALDAGRVAPVHDMRIYPSARAGAPELHFGAYEACVDALAWILENRNLMQALERSLGFTSVQVHPQKIVAAQTDDPLASVTLEDGARLQARLLVAADGAESPLRGFLGLSASHRDYPQQAVVANFAASRPHQDCAYQWFGDHGILALLPLPGERCSIVWSAPSTLAQSLMSLPADELARRTAEVAGHALGELRPLGEARCFPLRLIQSEAMVAPRAVLLGDAAHVLHPLAGQGMNLGFGDVAELLSVVRSREPYRELGDRLLLRRYERARREPVLAMKLATDGLQRLFDPDAEPALPTLLRPLLAARELGWQAVAGSGWLRRRLIRHAVS